MGKMLISQGIVVVEQTENAMQICSKISVIKVIISGLLWLLFSGFNFFLLQNINESMLIIIVFGVFGVLFLYLFLKHLFYKQHLILKDEYLTFIEKWGFFCSIKTQILFSKIQSYESYAIQGNVIHSIDRLLKIDQYYIRIKSSRHEIQFHGSRPFMKSEAQLIIKTIDEVVNRSQNSKI